MPTVIDTQSYAMGAGDVDVSSDAGVTWGSLGATMDNNVFRVRQTKFTPTLNGVKGPVKGLTRVVTETAELEVTIPELSAARLGLIIPGTSSVTSPTADATGTPGASTLSTATISGQSTITVASATNFVVGDYVRIELAASQIVEYRKITALAGSVLTLDRPLINPHIATTPVAETTGDGRTTITGLNGVVIPVSSYNWYRLRMPTLKGLFDFVLKDAINITDASEIAAQNAGQAAPRLVLQANYDPANTAIVPWYMVTP